MFNKVLDAPLGKDHLQISLLILRKFHTNFKELISFYSREIIRET